MAINYNDPWVQQQALLQYGGTYGSGYDPMMEQTAFDYSGEGAQQIRSQVENPQHAQAKADALRSILFGTDPRAESDILGRLQSIGAEAGLPADFDWTPHLVASAQQRGSGLYNYLETPTAQVIGGALASAASQAPQLSAVATRYQQGGDLWNQSVAEQQQRAAKHKSNIGAVNATAYTGLAAMLGGAALAGEAGAGSAAAGSGAGGAVAGSDAALAAGAAGGAAGTAGGGLTAAQAAGITSGAGAAGGALAGMEGSSAAANVLGEAQVASGGAASAAPAATGAASTGTALSRILNGTATSDDYLRLAGQIGPSLLSAYGSNKQANAQERLAAEYRGMGAPYRSRLADLYANPSSFLTSPEVQIPVQQGTDATARALSVQGNPAGSGRALSEIQNYASNQLFGRLGQEKDRLAGFGGLSAYNAAAPGAANAAINAQGQVYGDLGYGVGQALNPQQQSLAALLKQYQVQQGLA